MKAILSFFKMRIFFFFLANAIIVYVCEILVLPLLIVLWSFWCPYHKGHSPCQTFIAHGAIENGNIRGECMPYKKSPHLMVENSWRRLHLTTHICTIAKYMF